LMLNITVLRIALIDSLYSLDSQLIIYYLLYIRRRAF